MHIGWTPPPHGFLKLNTDGFVQNNPSDACAGGIIRDSHDRWIISYTRKIGHTHSMVAELWGLHDGLTLTRNLNIRKLLVEVDASVVANLFFADYSMQDTTHPFSAIIIDYRFLLPLFKEVHLKHIHCEGNQ